MHDQVTSEMACPRRAPGRVNLMPAPYPQEFRDDVVRAAENREDGVTIEQIAKDFGAHPVTLQN